MKRLVLGMATVGLLAASGCATDPTGSLSGTPTSVSTTLSFVNLNVGDSVLVIAETRDAQGVPLPLVPTAASSTPAVATVAEVANPPLSQTNFYIKAVGFGLGSVTASAGGVTATIMVQTMPPNIAIAGAADTLGSGSTVQLSPDPQDALGNSITADTIYTWSSSDASILSVDSTGLVSAAAPGTAEITVTGPTAGSAGGAEATISMVVVAGPFGGTLSAASGAGGELVTINSAAGGPDFDSDTQVDLGGEVAWIESMTTGSIVFAVPATGTAGAQDLTIANMGPTQIAQIATFDNTDANGDVYSPGNFDTPGAPDLASILTANGNVYFTHFGDRGIFNGGSEVDHYFAVTAGATDLNIDVLLEWGNGSDVDVYVCDNALASCPFQYFSGSSTDEVANGITIPAGETWFIIASMWDAGSAHTNFRMSVSGL